jgi:hypothetical protein
MENNKDALILSSLNEMYNYCQEIHTLLKSDVDYFNKNSFELIAESNKKKTDIMTKLAVLTSHLSMTYPDGLKQQIEKSTAQDEMTATIDRLNAEVKECNNFITTNSQIVFSNLQTLKDIWDGLAAAKKQNNVYDQTGSIVS